MFQETGSPGAKMDNRGWTALRYTVLAVGWALLWLWGRNPAQGALG